MFMLLLESVLFGVINMKPNLFVTENVFIIYDYINCKHIEHNFTIKFVFTILVFLYVFSFICKINTKKYKYCFARHAKVSLFHGNRNNGFII